MNACGYESSTEWATPDLPMVRQGDYATPQGLSPVKNIGGLGVSRAPTVQKNGLFAQIRPYRYVRGGAAKADREVSEIAPIA